MAELTDDAPPRRITVLYVAPWVDLGGSDRNTVDLLRWLDRDRYRVILATTQESRNRRLAQVSRYVDEIWALPELVPGGRFPTLLLDLIATRDVDVLHIMNTASRSTCCRMSVALPRRAGDPRAAARRGAGPLAATSATSRPAYGNLVDALPVVPKPRRHPRGVRRAAVDDRRDLYGHRRGRASSHPERAVPVELEDDRFHVLYLGRAGRAEGSAADDRDRGASARPAPERSDARGRRGRPRGACAEPHCRAGLGHVVLLPPDHAERAVVVRGVGRDADDERVSRACPSFSSRRWRWACRVSCRRSPRTSS